MQKVFFIASNVLQFHPPGCVHVLDNISASSFTSLLLPTTKISAFNITELLCMTKQITQRIKSKNKRVSETARIFVSQFPSVVARSLINLSGKLIFRLRKKVSLGDRVRLQILSPQIFGITKSHLTVNPRVRVALKKTFFLRTHVSCEFNFLTNSFRRS